MSLNLPSAAVVIGALRVKEGDRPTDELDELIDETEDIGCGEYLQMTSIIQATMFSEQGWQDRM